ncbi:MAG: GNAT family N-acetyltransferase [Bacilli bacterium]|nr:GNAT family N-acetyltransferase [Bacilli bacterium]
MSVRLVPLTNEFKEEFIRMNQAAFKYGAGQYFCGDEMEDQYEEEGEIISRETIVNSIRRVGSIAYRIVEEGRMVGGIIVNLDGDHGELEIFFIDPAFHSKGMGQEAWGEIERIHSNVKTWETVTPCFEKRNIHFYVNKLGFHIVEYYNEHHCDPETREDMMEMYRFKKKM